MEQVAIGAERNPTGWQKAPACGIPEHVVFFSGGVASWSAARRVAERYGTDKLVLLFTDTKIEDESLYQFLEVAAASVGGELIKIEDGRDPWQIFRDAKMLGSSRVDPCSQRLKRNLMDRWVKKYTDPEITTLHFGLDWTEIHRVERLAARKAPWRVSSPMTEPPYLTKPEMIEQLRELGMEPPRLYGMGFPHNNCGGFCVKAGRAHFVHLLKVMPDRFAYHEEQERNYRSEFGDFTILTEMVDGEERKLTLQALRERVEKLAASDMACIFDDWGGCGCAVE